MINIKPYMVMLLKLLYTPVLEERSSAANRAFVSSCAAVLKYASQSQAQKLIKDTASLHLGWQSIDEYGVRQRFMALFDSRFYCCSSACSSIQAVFSIIGEHKD
ncbi:hypothetical protein CFC21_099390 [Triticum aestivum]|uniref:Proteasome adapter and scaffold protein ECM29 HEAT-repeat domain-containing protein n=2 Tax=Triticum aestivum TaxID=4565 RepID=A0A3B6RPA7_WHEAT|nr:hypothetical protein CFC21_099390 [Triticum aestivum]